MHRNRSVLPFWALLPQICFTSRNLCRRGRIRFVSASYSPDPLTLTSKFVLESPTDGITRSLSYLLCIVSNLSKAKSTSLPPEVTFQLCRVAFVVKRTSGREKQEFRVRKRCLKGCDATIISQEVDDQIRRAEHYFMTGVVLPLVPDSSD